MRLAFLFTIVVLSAPAWALRRPTKSSDLQKLADIQLLMDVFNVNLAEERKLLQTIDELRQPGLERLTPDFSSIRKHMNRIAALQAARRKLGPSILRQTIDVYDLRIQGNNPQINYPGDSQGQPSPWTAIYLATPEREITDVETNQRAKFHLPPIKKGHSREGFTWKDGVISVFDAAFTSPAMLAATIVHENVHYENLIDPKSRKNPPSELASERMARRRLLDVSVRDDLLLSTDERKIIDEQYQLFVQSPNDFIGGAVPSEGNSIRAELPSDFTVDNEALRIIHDDASNLDRRVQQEDAARLAQSLATTDTHLRNRGDQVFATNEAQRCGLTLIDSLSTSFRNAENLPVVMRYHDPESFRASLLLVWVCGRPDDSPPCNDSMEVLAARWDEEGFKDRLLLRDGSTSSAARCVAHIVANLKDPKRYSHLLREKQRSVKRESIPTPPQTTPSPRPRNPDSPPSLREPRPTPPPDRPRCRYQGDWCK